LLIQFQARFVTVIMTKTAPTTTTVSGCLSGGNEE
jgi:hypothetical protein